MKKKHVSLLTNKKGFRLKQVNYNLSLDRTDLPNLHDATSHLSFKILSCVSSHYGSFCLVLLLISQNFHVKLFLIRNIYIK